MYVCMCIAHGLTHIAYAVQTSYPTCGLNIQCTCIFTCTCTCMYIMYSTCIYKQGVHRVRQVELTYACPNYEHSMVNCVVLLM